MENTPASSRELLKQIADAKLLEKCGGPYLDEEALLSLPTLSEAVNIIGGMQLDATAHSQWDRHMVAAWSACAARFRKQKGILGWLSVPRQMEERERRLFDLTTEKVEAWSVKAGLPSVDGFVVNEHLATLFSRASLLLDAEIAPAWPLIMDATRYALMGYLPVDFTVEDNLARVVLF